MMEDRRSGRTKRQMEDAPKGAIYIWDNKILSYPRELSYSIGREDLTILEKGYLYYRANRLTHIIFTDIVVDHACVLSSDQMIGLRVALLEHRRVGNLECAYPTETPDHLDVRY